MPNNLNQPQPNAAIKAPDSLPVDELHPPLDARSSAPAPGAHVTQGATTGDAPPRRLAGLAEIIQILATGGVAATALGIAALLVQAGKYNIPGSILTFDIAAKAGLAPFAALVLAVLYIIYAPRSATLRVANFLGGYISIAVLPIVSVVMVIVVGLYFSSVWIIAFGFHQTLNVLLALRVISSNGHQLLLQNNGFIMYFGGFLLYVACGIGMVRWYKSIPTRRARRGETTVQEQNNTPRAIISIGVAAFVFFTPALFGIRWYLVYWKIDSHIGWLGILALSLLGTLVVLSHVGFIHVYRHYIRATDLAKMTIIGSASMAFVALFIIYITMIYPMLPASFGGGKPEMLTLWIKAEEFSEDARARLAPGVCTEKTKVVRCDNVKSVALGDAYFVLIGKKPPAVVVPSRSVVGFASSDE